MVAHLVTLALAVASRGVLFRTSKDVDGGHKPGLTGSSRYVAHVVSARELSLKKGGPVRRNEMGIGAHRAYPNRLGASVRMTRT